MPPGRSVATCGINMFSAINQAIARTTVLGEESRSEWLPSRPNRRCKHFISEDTYRRILSLGPFSVLPTLILSQTGWLGRWESVPGLRSPSDSGRYVAIVAQAI